MPVDVSEARLARLAARLREGPLPPPPDFVHGRETPFFPPRGAAWAVPFFFTAVKHLFGLWREEGGRFAGPVEGRVDGRLWRGDDFLLMAFARSVQEEPDLLLPARQAEWDAARMARILRDDRGDCPVQLLSSHAELARAHGKALLDLKWTPSRVLAMAQEAPAPLHRFAELLSQLPGYREDPLQRKTFLLGIILRLRPENFLGREGGEWPPVLDRHLLRVALRWGAVGVMDPEVQERLVEGRPVPPAVEEHVRLAAYDAFMRLLNEAGRSVPETFGLFQAARAWCPEDAEPDCPRCFFADACARRKELKAPLVRTTAY